MRSALGFSSGFGSKVVNEARGGWIELRVREDADGQSGVLAVGNSFSIVSRDPFAQYSLKVSQAAEEPCGKPLLGSLITYPSEHETKVKWESKCYLMHLL